MPCCLFTWHAYGTWYPDRPDGYVHWGRGTSPPNAALAEQYRHLQTEESTAFALEHQKLAIEEVLKAAPLQGFRPHAMASEWSHIHVLISWRNNRKPEAYRRSIRHSMSQRLNRDQRRKWFSRGGDIKRVRSQGHFDYLVNVYLPSHSGYKWDERKDLFL